MKRLSALICLVLAFVLCLTACADESEIQENTSADTWELDTKGTLVLYESFEMEDYEYFSSPWNSNREFVYSIEIQGDIDFIGGGAFCGCTNLESVEIPDGVTRIGYGAFYSCDGLTEVTIPDSVTTIEKDAFYYCTSLTSVELPDSVNTINDSAFSLCYSLESITIPAGVTELGDYVFSQCTSLTGITVDENNPNYADVDGVLFDKDITELICYPLGKTDKDYEIPDGVTTIDMNAFEKNETLESITIPASVTFIGEFSLSDCPNLTDIYYEGTEAEWNEITLEKYYDYQSEFTVHFGGE
ncbi:MAG: leucine-rich repeat domain-containing protein [Ruminococcus sp.]|nr:leucine-rich repeat domain-containing protein [Ruminococcus sp.]